MSHIISVITAVYNDADHIESSVGSILNQTITDFEYLIIDDGSTDRTPEILAVLATNDNRIKVIRQENSGPSAARNLGLKLATGDFIAIQDSDDLSDPTRFEKQLATFNNDPEIGLCGTHASFFGHIQVDVPLPIQHKSIITRMLFGNPIIHSSVMMRRSLIQENQFHYKSEFNPTEDLELWLQMSKITKLHNLKEYLVKYRIHEKSLSRTKEELQRSLANKVCIQALEYFLQIKPTEAEVELHKTLLNRTSERTYNDKQMQLWVRKLISQNKKLQTLDIDELNSLLIRKWGSYLFHHRNTSTNNISRAIKIWRGFKLFILNCLLIIRLGNLIRFKLN